MSIPILTPDNSFNFTCEDKTCGLVFPAPKPIAEVVNSTMMTPLILVHQTPVICPRCGASYRALIRNFQVEYAFQRMDVDLVVPDGKVLNFGQGH